MKLVFIIGFIALFGAITIAHFSPATQYEVSIYGATPAGFWLGFGVAIVIAIFGAAREDRARVTAPSLLLGGLSILTIAALPLIRGYRFYGLGDALTHLGWARSIAAGQMSPFEIIYPGNHIIAVIFNETSGIPVTQGMMVTVVIMIAVYLVFIPLTTWVLMPRKSAVLIAGISGFFVFFINNIGTHRLFHTYSLATFFFPFVLYLLLKHITHGAEDSGAPTWVSAASFVLPIASISLVILHPQVALNVLILVGAFAAAQTFPRKFWPSGVIKDSRGVYGQVVILAVFLVLWSGQHPVSHNMADVLSNAVANTVFGGAEAGEIVQNRGESTSKIGVSLLELFVKLFLIATVYTILSAGLVIDKFFNRSIGETPSIDTAVFCFTIGGVALVPFFLLHFMGNASGYFFRHIGFSMVIATILGSIALVSISSSLSDPLRSVLRPLTAIVVSLMMILSILTMFHSPFIFLANPQVSDQHLDGYESAFSHAPAVEWQDERSVWFTGIRTGPGRFDDAILPYDVTTREHVPNEGIKEGLPTHYSSLNWSPARRDHYIPITSEDRKREIVVWDEIRYSEDTLRSLDSQPGVNRVQSNGEFDLYFVDVSFARSPNVQPSTG